MHWVFLLAIWLAPLREMFHCQVAGHVLKPFLASQVLQSFFLGATPWKEHWPGRGESGFYSQPHYSETMSINKSLYPPGTQFPPYSFHLSHLITLNVVQSLEIVMKLILVLENKYIAMMDCVPLKFICWSPNSKEQNKLDSGKQDTPQLWQL